MLSGAAEQGAELAGVSQALGQALISLTAIRSGTGRYHSNKQKDWEKKLQIAARTPVGCQHLM